MRILLVDDTGKDPALLREALRDAGHAIVGEARDSRALRAQVTAADPELVIIGTQSPTRDLLQQLRIVTRDDPRAIVMFTNDGDGASIRAALDAGVTTYIVDGLHAHRVHSILEVAKARFDADCTLRGELEAVRGKLADRKQIERAKGLLMKSRALDEETAYRALRKLAMDRQTSLATVAQHVIDAADLLG